MGYVRSVVMILCSAAVAFAQQVTTADTLPASPTLDPLPCTVEHTKPKLNLGFRFQSGYVVRAPLNAYAGATHHWHIVFRVTPARGRPVYFTDSIDLSAPPQPSLDAVATGAFFTGEGSYDVTWTMRDDLGRACGQHWSFDAHLSGGERGLKIAMPPGTVGDFLWHPAVPHNGAIKTRRVTILVNAASPIANQGQSANREWSTLLAILSSLLEGLPDANVRLDIFNLDQQRELFRQDGFTTDDLNGIAHTADGMSKWAVDSQVLQRPSGDWDLIRDIESKEIQAAMPPDTVVFMGFPAASRDEMPAGMPQPEPGRVSRFFYLVYRPVVGDLPGLTWGQVPGELGYHPDPGAGSRGGTRSPPVTLNTEPPDPIEVAVRRMRGKTIVISSAATLSKAISDVRSAR
jgi:hypothetical protein